MNQRKTTERHAGGRHGTGVLPRLNLAPVMGRRDAAYDASAESGVASVTPSGSAELLRLMSAAEQDSCAILNMLSSPATIEREQNMLRHIRKIVRLLEILEYWRDVAANGDIRAFPVDDWDPMMKPVTEKISDLFLYAIPHLKRYRSYGAKSASAAHAERYKKSYSFYLDIYKSRLAAAQNREKGL